MLEFRKLENIIKYTFKKKELGLLAITHSSFANEVKSSNEKSNERLEFLGDSILSLIIAEKLFDENPHLPEGELTKIRSLVVCETTLAECSNQLGLGEYLLLGKGEILSGGRQRISILSDAFEALIAAIYLDGGYNEAKRFVVENLTTYVEFAVKGKLNLDYKTQLQELIQKRVDIQIEYKIVKEVGPDHSKEFTAEVLINQDVYGEGTGKSKKEAEQLAAKIAIQKLKI